MISNSCSNQPEKPAISERVPIPVQTLNPMQCSTSTGAESSSECCPPSVSQHSIGDAELQQLWEDAQAAHHGSESAEGCTLDASSIQHLPHTSTAPAPGSHESMPGHLPHTNTAPAPASHESMPGNKVTCRGTLCINELFAFCLIVSQASFKHRHPASDSITVLHFLLLQCLIKSQSQLVQLLSTMFCTATGHRSTP